MVFNSSAGADEALGPFSFFRQYSVHLPISSWLFPSNDILTVFPIQMHRQPMLNLPKTWSRSSQGLDLYIHWIYTLEYFSHRCFTPSFLEISLLVSEKKNFFSIYSHGGHLGHVTLTIYINFHSLFLRMLQKKFGFDCPSGFREKDVSILWSYTCIIAPGQRQTTPWAQNIFLNINLLSICSFLASFLPFNYIFLFFPIPMHGRPKLTLP